MAVAPLLGSSSTTIHDFRCGVLDVAEVDGDVLLTADGALGEITQLLKWRREGTGRVLLDVRPDVYIYIFSVVKFQN